MEKCKYCQEELAEGTTVCPHCGKDNAAEEAQVEVVAEETVEVSEETAAPVAEETAAEPAAEETKAEEAAPAEEPAEEDTSVDEPAADEPETAEQEVEETDPADEYVDVVPNRQTRIDFVEVTPADEDDDFSVTLDTDFIENQEKKDNADTKKS